MTTFLAICAGVVALVAAAAVAEAVIRRNRPRRPLVAMRPDRIPPARNNMGFGFDREWRPQPQESIEDRKPDRR